MTEKELFEQCRHCEHLFPVYALDVATCMYFAKSNISYGGINPKTGLVEFDPTKVSIDYHCDHFKRKD